MSCTTLTYKSTKNSNICKTELFYFSGLWHSVVVFFIPILALSFNTVLLNNGSEGDMLCLSTLVYSSAVLVVNFKVTNYYTMLFNTDIR